jgi:hypothetical protein
MKPARSPFTILQGGPEPVALTLEREGPQGRLPPRAAGQP